MYSNYSGNFDGNVDDGDGDDDIDDDVNDDDDECSDCLKGCCQWSSGLSAGLSLHKLTKNEIILLKRMIRMMKVMGTPFSRNMFILLLRPMTAGRG